MGGGYPPYPPPPVSAPGWCISTNDTIVFGELKDEIVPRFFFVSPLCSKMSDEILKNSVDLPETSRLKK